MMSLRIKNPHSVLAALETRPKDVSQIISPPGGFSSSGEVWEKVGRLAQQLRIQVVSGRTGGGKPDRSPERSEDAGRVSAAEAIVKERAGISTEELFTSDPKQSGYGLWLALDSLQDPHNVGAIFRAASFFGVRGIMVTAERSAPLSSAVYDVACGGVEYVPFTMQTNLQRGFEVAKEAGLWILGSSEHAETDLSKVERDRNWLLVLGNEEKGMRRLTTEACDVVCKMSPRHSPSVTSLNVSVAAGILISKLS
jgi:23S rRNA (guanosine2251-2'-O)-methyltransferase